MIICENFLKKKFNNFKNLFIQNPRLFSPVENFSWENMDKRNYINIFKPFFYIFMSENFHEFPDYTKFLHFFYKKKKIYKKKLKLISSKFEYKKKRVFKLKKKKIKKIRFWNFNISFNRILYKKKFLFFDKLNKKEKLQKFNYKFNSFFNERNLEIKLNCPKKKLFQKKFFKK